MTAPEGSSDPRDGLVDAARASLGRALASDGFIDRFYERFIAASPEVAAKFAQTDFARQKQVLRDSLFVMLVAAGTEHGPAHDELARLARRHSRAELDVRPELYDLWLESLLEAAREHDPEFDDDVETAWRTALEGPIAFMRSRY